MWEIHYGRPKRDCEGISRHRFMRVSEVLAAKPVTVQYPMVTVFDVLRIADNIHFEDPSSRLIPLLENETPIA